MSAISTRCKYENDGWIRHERKLPFRPVHRLMNQKINNVTTSAMWRRPCVCIHGVQHNTAHSVLCDVANRLYQGVPYWLMPYGFTVQSNSYSSGLHADFLYPVSTKSARNMPNQCGYACTPFSTTWLLLRRFTRYSLSVDSSLQQLRYRVLWTPDKVQFK